MDDPHLVEFFDRVAGSYDGHVSSEERAARALNLANLKAVAGEAVVEIGSGTGADLAGLAQAAGANHVRAVEASSKMIELARGRLEDQGLSGAEFHQQLAPPLPLADNSADLVCCAFTLELQSLPVAWRLLGEIHRVLRPGGRLGLVSLAATWPDPLGLSVSAVGWLERYLPADHDTVDWKSMLADAGLDVRVKQRGEVRQCPVDILLALNQDSAPPPPAAADCVKALQSRQPLERIRARQRLCLLGAAALPVLLPLLDSRKEAVRAEAAKCLSWIGDPSCSDALVAALEDGSQKVRWIAAEGLVALGDPAPVVGRLTRPCDDTHRLYGSAGHVIRQLRRRGHQQLQPLVDAFEHSEPQASVPVAASRLRP